MAWSQNKETLQQALDTMKQYRFVPTGIRIGADLIGPVKGQFQNNFSGWEACADVDFYRYYLAIEYGRWARAFGTSDSAKYTNSGNYWRVGADVNFLKKDPDKNMFFLGLRYARSNFSEQLSVITEDPIWGTLDKDYQNSNISSRWLELTTGIRVKMWKFFWMGYTARFKFGLKSDETAAMLPHDVPGYGSTHRETNWGFNYYILFRIPFRKTLQIPVLPK
jgi:hypothetical protein